MKKRRDFLPAIYFSVFLVVGFLLGSTIGSFTGKAATTTSNSSSQVASVQPVTGNGQHNILIIAIDRFDKPFPRLEGVWLLLYLPDFPKLTLIPLYPSLQNNGSTKADSLEKSFRLTDKRQPDSTFFASIRSMDLWWNSYVVMDETASAYLIERISGVSTNGQPINGMRAVAKLPLAWENPQDAVRAQASLLAGLCKKENQPGTPLDLKNALSELSNHLSSDINPGQLIMDWKSMTTVDKFITCEFPTIDQPIGAP
jgi:hypothetical protein